MIVSTVQPYFAPHAAFFAKAVRSDVMVLMDDVQFPQRSTWLTRNRFKNDQGVVWLSVPVWKKGLGLQKIREVRLCNVGRWRAKHLATLRAAYGRAPYFEEHQAFLEGLYGKNHVFLLDMNLELLRYLAQCLEIDTRMPLLSELNIDAGEPHLSVAVAQALGATAFLAQGGALKYLDHSLFEEAGIGLASIRIRPPVYPQLWGPFLSNLSVLDLLFDCGPAAARVIRMPAGGRGTGRQSACPSLQPSGNE